MRYSRVLGGKIEFSDETPPRERKKRDWLAVDAVFRKLFSGLIPLLTGKNTGNIAGLVEAFWR
jgi:hypothetical protein